MAKSQQDVRDEFIQSTFQFLIAELDVGLTFTALAFGIRVRPENKLRATEKACRAYDTAIRFRQKFTFDPAQENKLDERQSELKDLLEQLGEQVRA